MGRDDQLDDVILSLYDAALDETLLVQDLKTDPSASISPQSAEVLGRQRPPSGSEVSRANTRMLVSTKVSAVMQLFAFRVWGPGGLQLERFCRQEITQYFLSNMQLPAK
jgi:hypothetical protein